MNFIVQFIQSLIANPVSFLISCAAIVAVFGIVIFVHEFGHFIVAKKSGVKVEEFAFGFGPKIFSFQYGETLYSVNWIPLGGFNKFQGEVGEEYGGPVLEGPGSHQDPNKDTSRDFLAQPWHRRIIIGLAGPAMNYLLAFLVFLGIFFCWGEPYQINRTEVGDTVKGMPADLAGIKTGDFILRVQNEPVDNFTEMREKIRARPEKETEFLVKRLGKEFSVTLVPINKGGEGLIGVAQASPIYEHRKISIVPAVKQSAFQCWFISAGTVYYLYHAIRTHVRPDLSGPIGITQAIAKTAKQGMEDLLSLMAMISVAIGLFNLFPIPLLDGGHILYYLIEGVRGKPVSQKVVGKVNMVGMAILLGLMVLATMNDVQRLRPKSEPAPAAAKK